MEHTFVFPKNSLLTTIDNPYNPLTDWDKWYIYDTDNGYNTTNYVARLANLPVNAMQSYVDIKLDLVYQYVMQNDELGIYTVVSEKEEKTIDLTEDENFEQNMPQHLLDHLRGGGVT